jgi:HTH-type transcriptional regulator/antitoxin HigA
MTLTINQDSYFKLLDKMQLIPKIIETETEYQHALAVTEKLLAKKSHRTPEETTLLRLLVRLIEDYEEQVFALDNWSNLSPAEILQELLEAKGQKPSDLVGVISSSQALIAAIIKGEKPINKEQAQKLGQYFGVAPNLFSQTH